MAEDPLRDVATVGDGALVHGEAFYAEDVVTSSDGRAGVTQGKATVLAGSTRQMGQTENLGVHPLYSFEEENGAYPVGRFAINVEGEPTTVPYPFMFRRDADQE